MCVFILLRLKKHEFRDGIKITVTYFLWLQVLTEDVFITSKLKFYRKQKYQYLRVSQFWFLKTLQTVFLVREREWEVPVGNPTRPPINPSMEVYRFIEIYTSIERTRRTKKSKRWKGGVEGKDDTGVACGRGKGVTFRGQSVCPIQSSVTNVIYIYRKL